MRHGFITWLLYHLLYFVHPSPLSPALHTDQTAALLRLPDDVLLSHILCHLTTFDLLRVARVCKRMRGLTLRSELWEPYAARIQSGEFLQAMYDYEPQDETEVAVRELEEITVVKPMDENGWYTVRNVHV